jgi:hypothetical protein
MKKNQPMCSGNIRDDIRAKFAGKFYNEIRGQISDELYWSLLDGVYQRMFNQFESQLAVRLSHYVESEK